MHKIKSSILNSLLTVLFYILRIFPIDKKKIVFSNFAGKGYGDNPKYIYESLKNMNLSFKAVWIVDNFEYSKDMPKGIKLVRNKSIRKFYELATAHVWVDNCRKSKYAKKRKGQYYVMTWHGNIPLKKVEKDAAESLGREYVRYALMDSKQIDLMVSNGNWCTNWFKNSFWYDGDIIQEGTPRNDVLVINDRQVISDIKAKLEISQDMNIVMYAPTFRNNNSMDQYNLNVQATLEALQKKFGGEWMMLLRLHPSLVDVVSFDFTEDKILDVTKYSDMSELLAISDVVITDYSSTITDFAITGKPGFLFCTDIDDYYNERGFYQSIYSLPFPLAQDMDGLINNIENFNIETYTCNLKKFMDGFELEETGKASSEVAKRIANVLTQN